MKIRFSKANTRERKLLSEKILGRLCLLFIAFFLSQHGRACDCGQYRPKLERDKLDTFDLILVGRIDSVWIQGMESEALVSGEVLYKGIAEKKLKILFDGISGCRIPFIPGERWLIYAQYKSGYGEVHYCSRTRKYPDDAEEDEYTAYTGVSWDEEIRFLEMNFPKNDFLTEGTFTTDFEDKTLIDARRDLPHATNTQKIILLSVSLLGMGLIFLFVKKFLK